MLCSTQSNLAIIVPFNDFTYFDFCIFTPNSNDLKIQQIVSAICTEYRFGISPFAETGKVYSII